MPSINELNKTYGYWTVIAPAKSIGRYACWLCLCKCGNKKILQGRHLRDGKSKSCGCWDKLENGILRSIARCKINSNGCLEWVGRRDRDGYARYGEKSIIVSRYIYSKYKGEIPPNMCICHSCDNPGCINIEHLWVGTNKENNDDKVKKGRTVKGSLHHRHKLNEDDIIEIRKLYLEGISQSEISIKFGVYQGIISGIISGNNWKHVPNDSETKKIIHAKNPNPCRRIKLNENQVKEIKSMLREGKTAKQVSEKFSVNIWSICHIKQGRSWKHVE